MYLPVSRRKYEDSKKYVKSEERSLHLVHCPSLRKNAYQKERFCHFINTTKFNKSTPLYNQCLYKFYYDRLFNILTLPCTSGQLICLFIFMISVWSLALVYLDSSSSSLGWH